MSIIRNEVREYKERIKDGRKSQGLCIRCGKYPFFGETVYCERCNHHNQYQKEYRTRKKKESFASRICTWCYKEPVKEGRTTCDKCNERGKERVRRSRAKDILEGRCHSCTRPAVPGFVLCEHHREMQKKRYQGIKRKVFDHYGMSCVCCGETMFEFLTIDHIENNGAEHRKAIGKPLAQGFYQWLINNNFPKGYQTLCMNCNFAKGHYGKCPHEKEDL